MEASPSDDYWGNGCHIDDPAIDSMEFPGHNKLGECLESVRDKLILQKKSKSIPPRKPVSESTYDTMDFETTPSLPSPPPTTTSAVLHAQPPSPVRPALARPAHRVVLTTRLQTVPPKRAVPPKRSDAIEVLETSIEDTEPIPRQTAELYTSQAWDYSRVTSPHPSWITPG